MYFSPPSRHRDTGRQSIIRIVPSSTSLLTTSPATSARNNPRQQEHRPQDHLQAQRRPGKIPLEPETVALDQMPEGFRARFGQVQQKQHEAFDQQKRAETEIGPFAREKLDQFVVKLEQKKAHGLVN